MRGCKRPEPRTVSCHNCSVEDRLGVNNQRKRFCRQQRRVRAEFDQSSYSFCRQGFRLRNSGCMFAGLLAAPISCYGVAGDAHPQLMRRKRWQSLEHVALNFCDSRKIADLVHDALSP